MKRDWLWDKKISLGKARAILKQPAHPEFLKLAALLLSRKNSPAEVFRDYLSPLDFCQSWPGIRKIMKKDAWGSPRLDFWQAIFEKIRTKLKKQGTLPKTPPPLKADEFCASVGQMIKALRKKKGLTQRALARKLHISQQIISRIESGQQNTALLTLKDIATALQAKVKIELI